MARDFPDSFAPEPIDRIARQVISAGVHHEFQKKDTDREVWDTPPEVVPLFEVPESIKQWFGTRKGSLVVVGYLGLRKTPSGTKKHRLLVRCDCGRYEVRRANHWRKTGNEIYERCQFCDQREDLKVSHLLPAERERLDNLKRARHGLLSQADEMVERRKKADDKMLEALERKLINSYLR